VSRETIVTKPPGPTTRGDGVRHPALLGGGVFATLDELCALRRLAAGVDVTRRRPSGALRAGPYRSPFRGRGMELDEVREYEPGDDVRSIDWRVTARTGRVHSKRFHEEREGPVVMLVDLRPAMQFGTRGCFKSVAAARWAALVAWAALETDHRVGGVVLSARGCFAFAPRGRARGARGLMQELADATAAGAGAEPGSLAAGLAELRRIAPPGARAFVLSDFEDCDELVSERLLALHGRCDASCVLVYDPLEASAPAGGRYRISDGGHSREVSTLGARSRARWSEPFRARRGRIERFCVENRLPLLSVCTGAAPEAAALESFARRSPGRAPR
jgi:uncharacterized protein (DUF58 family)